MIFLIINFLNSNFYYLFSFQFHSFYTSSFSLTPSLFSLSLSFAINFFLPLPLSLLLSLPLDFFSPVHFLSFRHGEKKMKSYIFVFPIFLSIFFFGKRKKEERERRKRGERERTGLLAIITGWKKVIIYTFSSLSIFFLPFDFCSC